MHFLRPVGPQCEMVPAAPGRIIPQPLPTEGQMSRRAAAPSDSSWHLDKRVNISVMLVLLMQIATFIWWAAQTVEQFVAPPRAARPDLGERVERGTLMTHAESIALFARLGVRMMPELKKPVAWGGFTRERFAQRLIDEYRAAGVPPSRVFP